MFQNPLATVKQLFSSRLFSAAFMVLLAVWIAFIASFSGEENANASSEVDTLHSIEPNIPTFVIHIQNGNDTLDAEVYDGTIENALKRAGITLDEHDECLCDLDAPVVEDMTIVINKISYKSRKETVDVPYQTVYRSTNALSSGEKKLSQEGKNGSEERCYSDRYVNGKLQASVLTDTITTKEATNEVYLVGKLGSNALSPMPYSIDLDEKGQPVKYKDLIVGKCSAYTSDRGNAGTRTSCGYKAQVGIVAVDPKVIPYGTKMYITSKDGKIVYGYAVAGDTGGTMTAGRAYVDLFMNTYEECIQFGRREMNIYILE